MSMMALHPRFRRKMNRRGFTLIEIMIVIAIIAIVMTIGVPSIFRAMRQDDLARAVRDTIEGCKAARDRAIFSGHPFEFLLRENGQMEVRQAPVEAAPSRVAFSAPAGVSAPAIPAGPNSGFPRKLGEDVMVQLIDVNFVNLMEAPMARVRFYPNGTSDEFTVVYAWGGKQRTVTLDIVTGLASEFIKR